MCFTHQNVEIGCHGYLVAMVTEKQQKITIILHFSLFCLVALLIFMIERCFFLEHSWGFTPSNVEKGCHGYLVIMVTETQLKITIILHFSLFYPVALVKLMIE